MTNAKNLLEVLTQLPMAGTGAPSKNLLEVLTQLPMAGTGSPSK